MFPEKEEFVLRGLPISKGIGIGCPVYFSPFDENVAESFISKKEVEEEIVRYRFALARSRRDVKKLQKTSLTEETPEIVAILETHLEIMQDPLLTTGIEEKIRIHQQKTETVFFHLIAEYKQRFQIIQDLYFQERVRDVIDVSRRILNHLKPLSKNRLSGMPHNSIILAHELVPSETIEANSTLVSAFVTSAGGVTSHAAIIARAKGIPYVANVDVKTLKRMELTAIIVDGSEGLVIINPTPRTLKEYTELKRKLAENYKLLKSSIHFKAETIDGYEVRVFANLENPKEIDQLHQLGSSGVGLFRSEYLFLARRRLPTEEEQFEIYKKMARNLRGCPLVVRVFDIGGDKKPDFLPEKKDAEYFLKIGNESNPALGCRAIRFLLRYPEILKTQLRALLRAGHYGEIQILLPMVSDLDEIRKVREIMKQVKSELEARKIQLEKEIPLGCMIEVPSSALMCDALAKEADFFSIGTNDLIQYVLAADRNNPNTSELYFSTHPSILRLIRMIVASAQAARKPVLICGECAADPAMIPVFIGLGIREFSVAARHIPLVKHTIRKWRILEACRLAERALDYASALELKAYLAQEAMR
ncbi:MAG TPA: phosphoenolpyruvate--protein phosphotransferase [Chlamydiales bacterium]|nr:phosphoenolpyruvate--protein phosphotransferase [Chlamydiales bacterium]